MVDDTHPPRRDNARQLIIVSGLSGSGKSVALRTLEDLGYYCVDNLPAPLIPALVEAGAPGKLAVGVDVRNRAEQRDRLPQVLGDLARLGVAYRLIFLDAADEVLIKRYAETRRRHPLSEQGLSLAEALVEERRQLRPLVALADHVVDTSTLNVHQLRRVVIAEMDLTPGIMTLLFESFAYRRGVPPEADFLFDARNLPNPHWDARLRPLSGRDAPVRDWLEARAEVTAYADDIEALLQRWLPGFDSDGRSYVTICIGCTGGRHRSVYLVERLARNCRGEHRQVLTYHRELS
ncbi:MAG: RNase adapter RapZ [Xanthomonadales bacterium]|nr:RNase adapter RapZ [Xanthomonadales bacterium]MDL1869558.1 RNase adapter RapZ [Gammaproteobacteria bacterium PRO6]